MGFANRIQKGKGDIETASQAVINSAEDMQMIVYDVLDFAKPTRMKYKAESISNIIQEACNYCLPKAESKNVKLSIHTSDTQAEMAIDRSHMKRALINLINNAIDASTQGESVIINASTGEGCFIIGIRDYGEGMDKETLENVFIPFYSKKSSGTGLGMAIAKKIIEGHKGNIRINSQPGFGTEVIIELRAN